MIAWILRVLGIGKAETAPTYLSGKERTPKAKAQSAPRPKPKAKKTPAPKRAKKK